MLTLDAVESAQGPRTARLALTEHNVSGEVDKPAALTSRPVVGGDAAEGKGTPISP